MKLLITLLLFALSAAPAGDLRSLKAGDTVPSFTLKNHDGRDVALDTLLATHRYAVVMFVSTRCPVSNAYNTRMAALSETFAKKNIAFVGINSNKAEAVDEIRDHAKEHEFGFPVVKDANNVIADAYGALVTPEVYVVGAKRTLLYHGRIDDNRKEDDVSKRELKDALTALLDGKTVASEQPRAFGCSIKRVGDSTP